jgi:hypothetical protein
MDRTGRSEENNSNEEESNDSVIEPRLSDEGDDTLEGRNRICEQ